MFSSSQTMPAPGRSLFLDVRDHRVRSDTTGRRPGCGAKLHALRFSSEFEKCGSEVVDSGRLTASGSNPHEQGNARLVEVPVSAAKLDGPYSPDVRQYRPLFGYSSPCAASFVPERDEGLDAGGAPRRQPA